jgi:hypothetical protein
MPNSYRVYRLDQAHHVADVEWVTAENDEQAIAAARAMNTAGRREVWLGDRLVATIHVAAAEEGPRAAYWL